MTGPIFGGMMNDPSESKQDVGELNLMTLIGCTDERGDAWHRRDDLQGDESNHYPGLIPVEDVHRRLLGWRPQRAKVAYLVEVDDVIGAAPAGVIRGSDAKWYRVVETQNDRVGVLRDDNDYDLGVFKSSANHPPYQVTLLEEAERLTGTTLGISTAGVLAKGARAWVEYSMPETLHDSKSGFDYRPNLVRADSMDGTISLTTALTIEATVCNNTLTRNLLEAKNAGLLFRRKHTSGIIGDLSTERSVLGILEQVDQEFLADLHALLDQELNPKQRIEVMDILVPMTDDMSDRAKLLAGNKRDRLWALDYSPMVAPWVGTAWGEVQRFNTDDHWNAPVQVTTRSERNTWRTLTGKRAEADRQVVAALERVLA